MARPPHPLRLDILIILGEEYKLMLYTSTQEYLAKLPISNVLTFHNIA
jgi:hypothetical protein